ncbi:MAG TPA: hypothetical protein VKA70_11700 [Blastocatellia bacterium]|nr:hypothetical protein [Blastocatellia bacterium]
MAVHVEEMVSDVTAEPEPRSAGSGEAVSWEELAKARQLQASLARDRRRTAAEGYDD